MAGRFDYVKYDDRSHQKQAAFKDAFETLDLLADKMLPIGRAKSLVVTKLEEAYMWVGKAIRDEQIAGGITELEESRTKS